MRMEIREGNEMQETTDHSMKPFENKSQDCEVKDTKLVKKQTNKKTIKKTKPKKPTTKTKVRGRRMTKKLPPLSPHRQKLGQ